MPLPPDVNSKNLLDAMEQFDSEVSATPNWDKWTDNENFKFAIFHNFNVYPVKQIISMATGVSREAFSGGDQSNRYVAARGFSVPFVIHHGPFVAEPSLQRSSTSPPSPKGPASQSKSDPSF